MERHSAVLVTVGLLLCVGGSTLANRVTIQFDPDDLVVQASSSPYPLVDPLGRQQQAYPKMYRANDSTMYFGSFYHAGFAVNSSNADFFDFRANNTISVPFFNMFIQSAADAQTDNWGQGKLLDQDGSTAAEIFSRITQDASASAPTATSASGWTPYVITNPYGPGDPHAGSLVGWYNDDFVTDRSNDLMGLNGANAGNDHSPFSFVITLNETLALGDTVRLWLGFYGLSSPENPALATGTDYYAWTGSYTTSPTSLNVTNINAFEGVVYAEVVPEPATMLLLGAAVAGLGIARKRKLRS